MDVNENPEPMRRLGIARYPALSYETQTLSVIFLTKRKIRKFLSRLGS